MLLKQRVTNSSLATQINISFTLIQSLLAYLAFEASIGHILFVGKSSETFVHIADFLFPIKINAFSLITCQAAPKFRKIRTLTHLLHLTYPKRTTNDSQQTCCTCLIRNTVIIMIIAIIK